MVRWWAQNKFSEANHLMIPFAELLQSSLPAVLVTLEFSVQGVKLAREGFLHRALAQIAVMIGWVIGKNIYPLCKAKNRFYFLIRSTLKFRLLFLTAFSFEQPWVPKGEPGKR